MTFRGAAPVLLPSRPPTTKYQAVTLLIDVLAQHARVAAPLTKLSRALRKADSFAHMVRQQLLTCHPAERSHPSDIGVDVRATLRWFLDLEPEHPDYPGDPFARLHQLVSSMSSSSQAMEAMICFHFATAPRSAEERAAVFAFVLRSLAEAEPGSPRTAILLGLIAHIITDYSVDLEAELLSPQISAKYNNPSDLIGTVVLNAAVRGALPDNVLARLSRLREQSLPALVLGAYYSVVRIGAVRDLAHSARECFVYLEKTHGRELQRASADECAEYAEKDPNCDDLACVLRAHKGEEVNLLELLERALSLVAGGDLRRRRQRGASPPTWTDEEIRTAARRFNGWGIGHSCCQLMMNVFGRRSDAQELRRDIAALASYMIRPNLCKSVGDLFVNQLFFVFRDDEFSACA